MDATAGDTQEHGEAQVRPHAGRTPRRRAPDTVPFWGADAKIPVIREPSPVVGPSAPAPRPVAVAAPVAAPASAPAPAVAARPSALPARPDVYAVDRTVDHTVDEPLPRRRDAARDDGPRRIRPATALGAAGLLVLVAGLATPFVLSGPFGGTPDAAPVPAPPGTVTTYVPTVSGSAPVAVGTAAATTAPAATTTAGATDRPTAAATRTAASTPTARTTPAARRTTVTAIVTTTVAPATTQASTRPGEVFVDPAQYVGRQEDPVRAELEARGLDTADSWAFDTGRPRGTVVEVRPSGWVRDGGDVRVYVAWS
ncbi:hypothetical protein [Kineosporia sp. R_H_3]|uniref:hypothetical protein n=1 Tax=Kineosporia sp. R_H_3 TaxID=1961848 RepID=UPI000B4A5FA6|nr:hypothetical protein [Kineosporia sp. R_H_3]